MGKKENKNNDRQEGKAEKPEAAYKTIRFFDSFEEADEYEYEQYAKMSPAKRLSIVCEMRDTFWPEEKEEQPAKRRIHFKK